jgi:tRNA A-37 threonylcarbamoyl transferase component Bud32
MAIPRRVIERAISDPFSTGGSFQDEQLELLWKRCRLLFLTGLVISLIGFGVAWFVPFPDASLQSSLEPYRWATEALLHAASFAVALVLLYVLCSRDRRYLHAIAFGTVAVNIVLDIYNSVAFHPATDSYFGVSMLLFLSAAFIPWRPAYQIALAATATVWFLALQSVLYSLLPEYPDFWIERGGIEAFRDHTIWGIVLLAALGGTSALISRTLYTLTKSAHKAKRLGNYLIHDEIGKGGMGQVFLAQHSLLCRPTAVKVMRSEDGAEGTALARFEREVKLSATLTHPNTITIFDVGRTPERSLYYAMEYLEGLDLQDLVDRFGPLPPARASYILKQACGSLAEAHSRDIVHRDIKPSNIFLTRRGGLYDFVKVLDFGLAKQVREEKTTAITQSGLLFGTPRYLAPETVYGSEKIDGRSDLYCLGGVAYFLLTGQPPFTAESSVEVVVDHVKTIPQRPTEVSETAIPSELDDIVMKCLEKQPDDRYQTAADLEAALDAVSFDDPWSRAKAEEWWTFHGLIGEFPRDSECFFDADGQSSKGLPTLVVAERSG